MLINRIYIDYYLKQIPHMAETRGRIRTITLPLEVQLYRVVQGIKNPHSSWNTTVPGCEWGGVYCDKSGILNEINWSCGKFLGHIQLQFIPETLIRFELGGNFGYRWGLCNNLTGVVPFDSLPASLIFLDVSENNFQGGVDLTSLPMQFEHLNGRENKFRGTLDLTLLPASMVHLELAMNNLHGTLNFTNLPRSLNWLTLNDNNFSGTIDFRYLPKLEMLYLRSNQFEKCVGLNSCELCCSLQTQGHFSETERHTLSINFTLATGSKDSLLPSLRGDLLRDPHWPLQGSTRSGNRRSEEDATINHVEQDA